MSRFLPIERSRIIPADPIIHSRLSVSPIERTRIIVGLDQIPGDDRDDDLRINLPNAITLLGYASAIVWLVGGSPWFGIASILADELDGRIARATGQETSFGKELDWAVDLTLTGAVAMRIGLPWVLPIATTLQVARHDKGERPPIGSLRAAMMILNMVSSGFKPLPPLLMKAF